jgi:type IV pilus assembly protein PilN
MPRINLLPWREQQRQERKMAFLVGLGVATVSAAVATFAATLFFNSMIDSQQQRNARLQQEIVTLDRQIEEINSLEAQKQKFIARMQIIEKLQRSRPEIVHVFDTFVRTMPDGTYLTAITQTDQRFKIQGVAQSSTRVSTFMRNIEASPWLQEPQLQLVETRRGDAPGAEFTLFATQKSLAGDDEDEATPANRQVRNAAAGAPRT